MAAARTRSRFDREEAGPRNDVYTGLLTISLVAMIMSCLLLYLDYSQYSGAPPKVTVPAPAPREIGGSKQVAAPVETSTSLVAAPAKLPEPLAMGAPEPVELAPVITVAADVPVVPQQLTPAVAEAPIPAPQPAPPAPQPIVQAPPVAPVLEPPPAPPIAAAKTEPTPPQLQLPEPPPMPKLRSTSAPTPTPAPKRSDTDPPPLPKSIKQLPPQ